MNDDRNTMNLPERIDYLLQTEGISAYALAKTVGVAESSVSNWRRGKRTMGKKTAEAIAEAYPGYSVAWLLGVSPYINGRAESVSEVADAYKASVLRHHPELSCAFSYLENEGFTVRIPAYDNPDYSDMTQLISAWATDSGAAEVKGYGNTDVIISRGQESHTVSMDDFKRYATELTGVSDILTQSLFRYTSSE